MMQKRTIVAGLLLGMILCGCGQATETPSLQALAAATFSPTPESLSYPHSAAETPAPMPYPVEATPYLPPAATPYPPQAPTATAIREQLFTDPQGWYSIRIPADWQPGAGPNRYDGEGGFIESGYLPEMAFMPRVMGVCQWLANINMPGMYSVNLLLEPERCALETLPGITPAISQMIIPNPAADGDQRYLLLRGDVAHFDAIADSFAWLKSTTRTTAAPIQAAPSRPADEAFWQGTDRLPAGVTVQEIALPKTMQGEDPDHAIFPHSLLIEAQSPVQTPVVTWFNGPLDETNQVLDRFGYELREKPQDHLLQLLKEGVLKIEDIMASSTVYLYKTGEDERIAFLVFAKLDSTSSLSDASSPGTTSLVLNDAIIPWPTHPFSGYDSDISPILVDQDLLWARVTRERQVQVINTQGDMLFSFATYFGTQIPLWGFTAWDGHWILEIDDFVIQDGAILNQTLGFETVFDWGVVSQKPIFFFRKGPLVGVDYNSQVLPLKYEQVAHGFCCGLMSNNPSVDAQSVHFFGKRDGIWYEVLIQFPDS